MHSTFGMRAKGFLASVFAEQKQLALLSSQTPAERRKLVLDLLGISPIEVAVKRANAEAKAAHETLVQLKSVTGDAEVLKTDAEDAAAAATALGADVVIAEAAATSAAERAESARVRHEAIKTELEVGQQLEQRHDDAAERVEQLEAELAAIVAAEAELAEVGDPGVRLPERRDALALVTAVAAARDQLAAAPAPPEIDEPDDADVVLARSAAAEAAEVAAAAARRSTDTRRRGVAATKTR